MREYALIFILFILLSAILTYPLILNMGDGVKDDGDPLLNTWILSWHAHKITHLDLSNYFDANIFYPYRRTLAYSEFLFTQELFFLPALLMTGNPIFAYNFVFLLAFITSGFGMFVLARHLTGNVFCGILGGLIFSFCPFMFCHLSHIQIISAGGIPLAFFFLHRYFESAKVRHAFFFSLFFFIQILANGYYALYLSLFAGFFVLYGMIAGRRFGDWKFPAEIMLFIMLAAAAAFPFFYQYHLLDIELDIHRRYVLYADITGYLVAPEVNRIYGGLFHAFRKGESTLFPGIMPLILVLVCVAGSMKKRWQKESERLAHGGSVSRIWLLRLIDLLLAIWSAVFILIVITGGFHLGWLKAGQLKNPSIAIGVLLVLRFIAKEKGGGKGGEPERESPSPVLIYFIILIAAFILTMEKGPYMLLFRYVPGFEGLRVAARFGVFVMFSVAVLAALGLRFLLSCFQGAKRHVLSIIIFVVVLLEYFSAPLPLIHVPVKNAVPEVYRWLNANIEDDSAIIELPLPERMGRETLIECSRVYYSTCHWKKLVNGYSGHHPPMYPEMVRRWREFPLEKNIHDLKKLGVDYIVLHRDAYRQSELQKIISGLRRDRDIRKIKVAGDSMVWQIRYHGTGREGDGGAEKGKEIPRNGWAATSNVNMNIVDDALDGDMETLWHTDLQKAGDFFELDLGKIHKIQSLSLYLGRSRDNFPGSYQADISVDGITWETAAHEERAAIPILAFLKPARLYLSIPLAGRDARYVRITNKGGDPSKQWRICEIEVFSTGCRRGLTSRQAL